MGKDLNGEMIALAEKDPGSELARFRIALMMVGLPNHPDMASALIHTGMAGGFMVAEMRGERTYLIAGARAQEDFAVSWKRLEVPEEPAPEADGEDARVLAEVAAMVTERSKPPAFEVWCATRRVLRYVVSQLPNLPREKSHQLGNATRGFETAFDVWIAGGETGTLRVMLKQLQGFAVRGLGEPARRLRKALADMDRANAREAKEIANGQAR